jgi:hypothetical protein
MSIGLPELIMFILIIAAAIYGVAYIASKGAKRGSRD